MPCSCRIHPPLQSSHGLGSHRRFVVVVVVVVVVTSFPPDPSHSSDGDGGGDSDDVDESGCRVARSIYRCAIMVFLIWTMRSAWFDIEQVWFGREHPAFMWPPPHALVDRWPPLWVPHTVRLSNTIGGARILGFPPHAGRGDVHDPDEPPYRLITVGVDEVTSLVLIWNDGSRALHAPHVQCTRRACRARAARALRARLLRGNCAPDPAGLREPPRTSA